MLLVKELHLPFTSLFLSLESPVNFASNFLFCLEGSSVVLNKFCMQNYVSIKLYLSRLVIEAGFFWSVLMSFWSRLLQFTVCNFCFMYELYSVQGIFYKKNAIDILKKSCWCLAIGCGGLSCLHLLNGSFRTSRPDPVWCIGLPETFTSFWQLTAGCLFYGVCHPRHMLLRFYFVCLVWVYFFLVLAQIFLKMWASYSRYSCGTRADPGQKELSEDGFAAPRLSLFWAPSESFQWSS